MKNSFAKVALLTLALPSVPVAAQTWGLENHAYYEPVLAEPRGAQTTVLFPARADSFPYAVNDGAGLVWDISLGRELPIFGFSNSKGAESPTGVAPGALGVGIWMPLSFHMIEDMGKDPSNPILNTDYRFGGLVKVQWGLHADQAFWSSAHIGGKFQFGHESTHIGDEFTLGALRTHGAEFIRVNVSYEFLRCRRSLRAKRWEGRSVPDQAPRRKHLAVAAGRRFVQARAAPALWPLHCAIQPQSRTLCAGRVLRGSCRPGFQVWPDSLGGSSEQDDLSVHAGAGRGPHQSSGADRMVNECDGWPAAGARWGRHTRQVDADVLLARVPRRQPQRPVSEPVRVQRVRLRRPVRILVRQEEQPSWPH